MFVVSLNLFNFLLVILNVLQLIYCFGILFGVQKVILKFIAELLIEIASVINFKIEKRLNVFILHVFLI